MPLATSSAPPGNPLSELEHFVDMLLSRIPARVLWERMSAVHRRWAGRAVWWTCRGSCPRRYRASLQLLQPKLRDPLIQGLCNLWAGGGVWGPVGLQQMSVSTSPEL